MEQQSNFDIEAFKRESEAVRREGEELSEILLHAPPDKNTPEWNALGERISDLSRRQAEIVATVLDYFQTLYD